jgi:hypothetical protein
MFTSCCLAIYDLSCQTILASSHHIASSLRLLILSKIVIHIQGLKAELSASQC